MRKIEIELPDHQYELLQKLNEYGNAREVLMRLAYRAANCVEIIATIDGSKTRQQEWALDWVREAVLEIQPAREGAISHPSEKRCDLT